MKLTGWYTGDQKPERVGVYERYDKWWRGQCYSFWNGEHWLRNEHSAKGAAIVPDHHISTDQKWDWRGVAE